MSSQTNPCGICGCIDLNLVDGYYYCVECGTQDVNVRETIVESTVLQDGTYAIASKKKVIEVREDAVQMTPEWHKWHAYNFILAGLSDELIALGAEPTVKMKVLWIWVRYIKKFQKKDEPEVTQFASFNEEDREDIMDDNIDEENIDEFDESETKVRNKHRQFEIDVITKPMLLAILYVALNLDKSHIQLGQLMHFVREKRLSIYEVSKFVPKDLSVNLIPNWCHFVITHVEGCTRTIRAFAMTLFQRLDLGVPLVPDLNRITDNFIKELCVPSDFKDLVLSLMDLMPLGFLQMEKISMAYYKYTPDYETVCMSYILLAFKICFGLDCVYDLELTAAVDKINSEQNYLKSYKLGMYSEPTDRLFSFQEWYMYLQFRKMVLSRYYLPVAQKYSLPVDDSVFVEHLKERKKQRIRLRDNVTMDILSKIPTDAKRVIPKENFPVTHTPLSTYTEVLLEYIKDPDIKLRLCEDFSQYSLKYVIKDFKFSGTDTSSEFSFKGADETRVSLNPFIIGTLTAAVTDSSLVLVRNCDNQNWLKTKPPKAEHVIDKNSDTSDNCYDFCSENILDSESKLNYEECTKSDFDEEACDIIEEDDEKISIFHDGFEKLKIKEEPTDCLEANNIPEFDIDGGGTFAPNLDENIFEIEGLDREQIIQELINIACIKYKIILPTKDRTIPKPKKRKAKDEAEVKEPKIPKKIERNGMDRQYGVKMTQEIINAYYDHVNNEELLENIKSAVEMAENHEEWNIANDSKEINAQNLENNHISVIDNSFHINETDNHIESLQDGSIQDVTVNDANNDSDGENVDLFPKPNPNFDPKTHNINQLYVNVNEELDLPDLDNIGINDPDLNDFFDKKLPEFSNDVNIQEDTENVEQVDQSESSDDEEDVPLHFLRKKEHTSNSEYLVQNKDINKYMYWMKHYKNKVFGGSPLMATKFRNELVANYPQSFIYVLDECAAVAECSVFFLYRNLQKLEQRLMTLTRQ